MNDEGKWVLGMGHLSPEQLYEENLERGLLYLGP
jgi:hypothetical protein